MEAKLSSRLWTRLKRKLSIKKSQLTKRVHFLLLSHSTKTSNSGIPSHTAPNLFIESQPAFPPDTQSPKSSGSAVFVSSNILSRKNQEPPSSLRSTTLPSSLVDHAGFQAISCSHEWTASATKTGSSSPNQEIKL